MALVKRLSEPFICFGGWFLGLCLYHVFARQPVRVIPAICGASAATLAHEFIIHLYKIRRERVAKRV